MKKSLLFLFVSAVCGLSSNIVAKPEWLTAPLGAGAVVSTGIGVATYSAYQKMVKAKEVFELDDSAENEKVYLQASSRFKKLMGASLLSMLLTGVLAVMQKKTETPGSSALSTGITVSVSSGVSSQSESEASDAALHRPASGEVDASPTSDYLTRIPLRTRPPVPRSFPVPTTPAFPLSTTSIAQTAPISVRSWILDSNFEKIKEYLEAGGNPNAAASYDKYGFLDYAKDHKTAVLLLQKGAKSRDKEYFELMQLPSIFRSALNDRAGGGDESLLVFKEHGFDLNGWRGAYGTTFLSDMVREGKLDDIALILNSPLADVNAKNKDSSTALDRALGAGRLSLGKYREAALLLKHGAKHGSYAPEKIEVLLRKALADTVSGPAALAVFAKHGMGINTPVVESLDDSDILLTLLSEVVEEADLSGLCRLIHDGKADVDARNSDGSTPLMRIVLAKKPLVLGAFGTYPCPDATLQRNDGSTALMLAVEYASSMVEQLLMCSRAWKMDLNVNAVNKADKTALDIAAEKGLKQDLIPKLRLLGAKTAAELKA
ncbi:MAG: uncharacterized protein QG632_389 [Candidatus Dependentiae bacterium]|nr:uncharacterized protein [Candidatus Dependentiae bacterium]